MIQSSVIHTDFVRDFLQAGGKLCKKSSELHWTIDNNSLMEKANSVFPDIANELLGLMEEGDCWLDTTPAQQRFWLEHYMLDCQEYCLISRMSYDFDAHLDPQKLEVSLERLVQRHAPFRTNFRNLEGYPIQVLRAEGSWPLVFLDLQDLQGDALQKRVAEETLRTLYDPIGIESGPVFRATLMHLGDGTSRLVFGLHHIAIDGSAIVWLLQELPALYNSPDPALYKFPDLKFTYEDYLKYTHQWNASTEKEACVKFWRENLADIREVPSIPTLPRHLCNGGVGGTMLTIPLPPSLWELVGEISNRYQITKYRCFLTLYVMFLNRLTGLSDIIIGTPYANRPTDEIKSLMGLCLNTLPIRVCVDAEDSFHKVFPKVDEALKNAMTHGALPFQEIYGCSRASNELLHKDLFQSFFIYQNLKWWTIKFGDSILKINYDHNLRYINYHTLFEIFDRNDGMKWQVTFQNDKYSAEYIEDTVEHLERLMRDALENPDTPAHELKILSAEQLSEMLFTWNQTKRPYPEQASLVTLFEEVVKDRPDAVAIRSADGMMTYRELDARANQLAHCLAARGVGLEDCVAVILPRSADAVCAILGILKVGAAYVPVDTEIPTNRIEHILRTTNVKCLVTSKAAVFALKEFEQLRLNLDDTDLSSYSTQPFPCPANGVSLAYVMFTSGSTGEPKGVCVEHRNIIRYLVNAEYFNYDATQCWLMFSPMAFDGSTTEIWGALLHGATLAIHPPFMPTLHELGAFIQKHQVTSLFLTPTLFNQMVELQLESLSGVKQCTIGGDIVSVEHARRFLKAFPGRHLLNGYGPTETTACATAYSMRCVEDVVQPIPIGKPISNTRCYVLDPRGQPVPIGVEGELYIGGDGVSRGYINDAAQNAERFIMLQLPGMDKPERVYKSGDLVRWLPDGNLEFIGRRDNQIKLNGFRIELGEIEAQLCQEPSVSEAHVVVQSQNAEQKRLVAFVKTRPGAEFNKDRLIDYLSVLLPPIMVPHHYVEVKSWPMTGTGKVDRLALQKLQVGIPAAQQEYDPPQGRLEEELAVLWKELLGIDQIGRHDNFFALGGHSLKATRLLSSIRLKFGREIGFHALFQHPTLAAFAAILVQDDTAEESEKTENDPSRNKDMSGDKASQVESQQWHTKFPMSFAQQRLWLINQIDSTSAAYNMPYFVSLKGRLNVNALERVLNEIVMRHESLRTTFGVYEGQPVQRVSPRSAFAFKIVPLSAHHGEPKEVTQKRHLDEEFTTPFNLEQGPLFRGRLVQVAEEEHLLLLCMHHIISDGWSLGVLTRELSVLYNDFLEGKPSSLPPLGIQYADFTLWQREYLQGEVRARQEKYWLEALQGMEPVEIPTNNARPAVLRHEANKLDVMLPDTLVTKLGSFCQQRNLTLFMTALAGFYIMQHRYTGQKDLSVGSPIANRNRQEIEGLIGFFVNTLVLRTRVTEKMTFEELLKNVQNTALSAYDNQDLPFEYLVEKINPERDASRNPLFQIMFAVQNVSLGKLQLKDIELGLLWGEMASTRFDMEIHLFPNQNNLQCIIYYNSVLFEPWFIEQMCTHWFNVLECALTNSRTPISQLSMLGEDELRREAISWNQNSAPYPHDMSVATLFESAATRFADKKAIVSPYASLTYGELNAWSNRFAHYLRSRGIGLEDRVAILMSRNPFTVGVILGILKAGAAYVPIDVDFPISRIRFMFKDTGAKLLVTESHIGVDLEEFGDSVIRIDGMPTALDSFSSENPPCEAKGENMAYVMYTSGSTGLPKGVCVEHRNISRLVMGADYMDFDESQTWLMFSPLAFDASTLELWGSLLHGAALAVYPSFLPSLAELGSFIKDYNVTSLFLTTSLFNQMGDQQSDDFGGVGQCVTGGEIMSVEHVRRLLKKWPKLKLANVYGPTECTTFATFYPLKPELDVPDSVPIGAPLPNTTCYILDGYGQPVPPGVTGDLHIGGGGVARGYLNSPDLTNERFISILLAGMKEAERVYKTGDLARYLQNGNIEFVGRRDHQIKMRGFRIELGEIESALRMHPDISEAVVLLQESATHNKSLAAYITLDDNFNRSHENVEGEQVDHWLSLYNETYAPESDKAETLNNFLGWNSSYTGDPIPEEEMVEWAEATTGRLKKFGAKRVLELGCGTGLLIGRIAPGTESYIGVDFSEMVLKHTRALVASRDELKHVRLFHKRVDDLAEFSSEKFDLIILNSVVQYFPSIDYLLQVIKGASALLAPGGIIYLGDLRAFPLHEHYAFSVQLHQAKEDAALSAILDTARRNIQREEELLIAPDFFYALQGEIPLIKRVTVSPKTGKFHNELTKFRYEVELHSTPTSSETHLEWLPWNSVGGLNGLRKKLDAGLKVPLAVKGIPNARLAMENFALHQAAELEPEYGSAGKINSVSLDASPFDVGVEPDALHAMALTSGYAVIIDWSDMAEGGALNAVFYQPNGINTPHIPTQAKVRRPWRTYANNPLQAIFAREIVPKLRQWLLNELPEYMVPANYAVIEKFPLNKSGKIDRTALARLAVAFSKRESEYVAPKTETEKFIAACFEELLGISQVGARDNFFDLGGHSLLATQLISRIQESQHKALPLRQFFEEPTVAAFALKVDATPASGSNGNGGASLSISKRAKSREELLMERLSQLSEDDLSKMLQQLDMKEN